MKLRNLVVVISFLVVPLVNGYAGLLDGIAKALIPPCPRLINIPSFNTDDDENSQKNIMDCTFGGGGVNFHDHDRDDDVDKNGRLVAFEVRQWSDTAPDWRCHTRGGNLLGNCTNSSCPAYNKEVVCGLGIGTFYVIKNEKLNITPNCPMCHKSVIPTTSSYNNCHYRVIGKKTLTGGTTDTNWKTIGNCCITYNNDDNRVARYSVLKIETKDLSEEKPEEEEI